MTLNPRSGGVGKTIWMRRLRLLPVAAVSGLLVLTGSPNDSSVQLDVGGISQEQDNWCWAACGQMIMAFYGVSVSQCRQAGDEFAANCCPVRSSSECDKGGWPLFELYGFSTSPPRQRNALTFSELQAQFKAGRPVAFSWLWGPEEGGRGHMMVAAGCKVVGGKQRVWVINPLPVEIGGKGSKAWRAYDYFVCSGKDCTHWADYYDIVPAR